MNPPSDFVRSSFRRAAPATSRNVFLGPGSGGNMGSGTGNMFIGGAAGSAIRSGSNNIIIGSYPGTPELDGSVVISSATGRVLTEWDESGVMQQRLGDYALSGGPPPNPTALNSVIPWFDPSDASMHYRVRDADNVLRTLSLSATPAPVTIAVRPADVTRTSGSAVVLQRFETPVGMGPIVVPTIRLDATPPEGGGDTVVDGAVEFILNGVPAWAGKGVLELWLTMHCAAVPAGPFNVKVETADGSVYTGSVTVLVGAATETVPVVWSASTKGFKEGTTNRYPLLDATFGAAHTQPARMTVKGDASSPAHILGLEWCVHADPSRGWKQ